MNLEPTLILHRYLCTNCNNDYYCKEKIVDASKLRCPYNCKNEKKDFESKFNNIFSRLKKLESKK